MKSLFTYMILLAVLLTGCRTTKVTNTQAQAQRRQDKQTASFLAADVARITFFSDPMSFSFPGRDFEQVLMRRTRAAMILIAALL